MLSPCEEFVLDEVPVVAAPRRARLLDDRRPGPRPARRHPVVRVGRVTDRAPHRVAPVRVRQPD